MPATRQRGFTLIELMITVVLIVMLAAVALPNYRQHVVRGKRSAAQSVMMDIANREQQFFLANRVYADKAALESNGYALPSDVGADYDWDVTTSANPVPAFVITFTGKGGQAVDNSPAPLTLDSFGNKAPLEKWQR